MNIEDLKNRALEAIKNAKLEADLEKVRIRFLGRKSGEITNMLKSLKDLSIEEKRKTGPLVNALRDEIEQVFNKKLKQLTAYNLQLTTGVDISMPGEKIKLGHLHPITIVEKEIREIFKAMNFSVIEGPEVESEHYNFDALNIPKDHPARDMWDTFWLRQNKTKNNERLLLRTHTSPMQIRYMETHKPPFQIIVPGRVFRYEATDALHEFNFHQVEGLMVGKNITLANFKFVIEEFFNRLFKKELKIRLRPSYFPFVEPGLEVDIQCVKCSTRITQSSPLARGARTCLPAGRSAHTNDYCPVCKGTGWLEVMGAGMVHPKVFEAAHYNPRDFQGFAFGLGLERVAMIKYNIPDIRLFFSGDLRFIKQF